MEPMQAPYLPLFAFSGSDKQIAARGAASAGISPNTLESIPCGGSRCARQLWTLVLAGGI
jgi:hypothetical protein